MEDTQVMERVLDREHRQRALRQGKRTTGAPGIDGMRVDDLGGHRRRRWPSIRATRVAGTCAPQPVRRVEIPKPGGGVRKRGVPAAVDRVVEPVRWQVWHAEGAPTWSPSSVRVRPERSAHQAVAQAQAYLREGYV